MRRVKSGCLCVALVLLTCAAFHPVWENDFVNVDDEVYITKNRAVLDGWTARDARWAWDTYHGSYWQPLSWLSLQGDATLFSHRGPDGKIVPSPAAFHGENLAWHTATTLLLFGLCRRLTGAPWRSFLIAAIFAVHPLRVESVAWAAERKDVLSCFFGVVTLWAYVLYLARPGWWRYAGLFGCYILSLLAKPMLMTLPFVLLLLDYWPLGRVLPLPLPPGRPLTPARVRASLGRLLGEKVPLIVLSGIIMLITLEARERTWPGPSFDEFPLFDRLAVACAGYGWYLGHSIMPVGLTVLYPHPQRDWSVTAAVTGLAVLLAVTAVCAWQARRRPWLVVGWLWFAGSLVPVMGLALNGEQAWADRFTYWPHIGLVVAVVWQFGEIVVRRRLPAAVAGVAATAVLATLGGLTWVQVGHWRDTEALWTHNLAVTEDNYAAHDRLGNHYAEQGRLDLAVIHFAEATRLRPESPVYQFKLGRTLARLGREEEAVEHLQAAVDLDADFVPARRMLADIEARPEWHGTHQAERAGHP